MIGIINSIKNIALEMKQTTSVNDDRHDGLQGIADLCDELLTRCIDETEDNA